MTTPWSSGYACDSDEVVNLIRRLGHLLKVLPSKYFLFNFISFFMNFILYIDYESYIHIIIIVT